jgi:hypothetical protein
VSLKLALTVTPVGYQPEQFEEKLMPPSGSIFTAVQLNIGVSGPDAYVPPLTLAEAIL